MEYNSKYINTKFGLSKSIIITLSITSYSNPFNYDKFISYLEEELQKSPHELIKHRLLDYNEHLIEINEMFGGGMNKEASKAIYLEFENEVSAHVVLDMISEIGIKDRSFKFSSYSQPKGSIKDYNEQKSIMTWNEDAPLINNENVNQIARIILQRIIDNKNEVKDMVDLFSSHKEYIMFFKMLRECKYIENCAFHKVLNGEIFMIIDGNAGGIGMTEKGIEYLNNYNSYICL